LQKVLKFVCFCCFSKDKTEEEENDIELADSASLKTSKLAQINEKNR